MKILAVVTARAGSKRLPDKNILLLGEKPVVMWTIDTAMSVPEIGDVLVSTDDARIADMARSAGAVVPWLRPAELATDDATSVDVVVHALDWYEEQRGAVDGVLLLQPTSPFRRAETIQAAIRLFLKSGGQGVVSVSPARSHPDWCFVIEEGGLRLYSEQGKTGRATRHQDLPAVYALNGAIYLASPSLLKSKCTFLSQGVRAMVMEDPVESLDIDTPFDFFVARCAVDHQHAKPIG